jgi:hypothetical protein
MPFGAAPSGIFYWRIVSACKRHVYNVISPAISLRCHDADHLGKIKRALLEMQRNPRGRKSAEFEGLARALGRQRDNRGKEPTYMRRRDPELTRPLSIPAHSADVRIGTAMSIIDTLLDDVAQWESYLRGERDGKK